MKKGFIQIILLFFIFNAYAQSQKMSIDTIYYYQYSNTREGWGGEERFYEWKKNNPNSKVLLNLEDKKIIEKIFNDCRVKSVRFKINADQHFFEFVSNGIHYDMLFSWDWFYNLSLNKNNEFYWLDDNEANKQLLKKLINKYNR